MENTNITLEPIKVEDFINLEYRNYALYSIYSRAIPSAIDGFKPSQRKVVWTANKTAKEVKKTSALAGDTVSHADYHHGSTSLEDTIVVLSRQSNNLPILGGNGYFGTRVVPKSAAARYTKSKIGENFKKYFLDNEIAPNSGDCEPDHFLPLIPWTLVNGINGIAVGYSTTIQPRSPELLIRCVAAHLKGRNISSVPLPPHFPDFKGEIKLVDGVWKAYGVIKHKSKTVYDILDLPAGHKGKDRIQFVRLLNELRKYSVIDSYKDRCSKQGFHFEIKLKNKPNDKAVKTAIRNEIRSQWTKDKKKFKPEQLETAVDRKFNNQWSKVLNSLSVNGRKPVEVIRTMIEPLQMVENLHDNITTIGHDGNLKIFDTAQDLIKYFTDYRLSMYTKRFQYRIERDTKKLKLATVKYGFINAVMNGKIVLKGKSRKESKALIMKVGVDDETADLLLRMPVHSFCTDELEKLKKDISVLKAAIQEWKTTDCKKAFLLDLKNLL